MNQMENEIVEFQKNAQKFSEFRNDVFLATLKKMKGEKLTVSERSNLKRWMAFAAFCNTSNKKEMIK